MLRQKFAQWLHAWSISIAKANGLEQVIDVGPHSFDSKLIALNDSESYVNTDKFFTWGNFYPRGSCQAVKPVPEEHEFKVDDEFERHMSQKHADDLVSSMAHHLEESGSWVPWMIAALGMIQILMFAYLVFVP